MTLSITGLPLPLPVHAWLPLGLAALAPLALLAVFAPPWRRQVRGIAAALALRTVLVLGLGTATIATVATVSVVRAGLRELRDRHDPRLHALASVIEATATGRYSADASLLLADYQSRAASGGFVAYSASACQSACLIIGDQQAPAVATLKSRLAQSWPKDQRAEYFVRIGDRPFLLLTEPVHDTRGVAIANVVAGVDAQPLADHATRTAWTLLIISYTLLVVVGWSSWQQLNSSLAARIHAITEQIQDGRAGEPNQPHAIAGKELGDLANSVSAYIQSRLEEQRETAEHHRRLAELAPDGIIMCSSEGITFVNAAALALAGTSDERHLLGRPISDFLDVECSRSAEPGTGVLYPGRWRRLDGTELHADIAEITDSSRQGIQQFVVRDVTDRRLQEAALAHRAEHDALTGLVNRGRFETRLEHMLTPADAPHGHPPRFIAVLYIDLDGFKRVNDRHGHAAGDAVLIAVAARLRESTRDQDVIARLGGDEFAVLLDLDDHIEVNAVAARILDTLQQPVRFDGMELRIGASIGIADTRSVEAAFASLGTGNTPLSAADLLRAADAAMYSAKAGGGHSFGRVAAVPSAARQRTGRALAPLVA